MQEFSRLPGVGRKTALRLVLHLLRQTDDDVLQFTETIARMKQEVKYCRVCHNISDSDVCPICSDPHRDPTTVCVVENIQDVLAVEAVRLNPANRCYHCKQAIFTALLAAARARGYDAVMDGTNASDDAGDRPGMRALGELGVLSPLRLCGVTKDEVREYSRRAGLFTWDKPAYACLATRVPSGTPITSDMLASVEGAEGALFEMGFTDFRVRLFHGAARLQLPGGQMARALDRRAELRAALAPWFDTVMLDLKDR